MDKTIGIEEDVLHKSAVQLYRLFRRTVLKKNKDTGAVDKKWKQIQIKLDELFKTYLPLTWFCRRQSSASKKSGKLNDSKAATAVNNKQRDKKKSKTKGKNSTESTDNFGMVHFMSPDLMSIADQCYTELHESGPNQSKPLAIRPPSPVFVNLPSVSYDSCQTKIYVGDAPFNNSTTQAELKKLGSATATGRISLVPSRNLISSNCAKMREMAWYLPPE